MFRRILGVVLMVLGLAVAGAAVGSATIWKPDEVVTLSTTTQDPYIVTAPGVLDVVDSHVDIELTGADADEPLVMILGLEHEILAWLGEDATYTEITGLESWEVLTTDQIAPEPVPTDEDAEEEPAEEEEPITLDPRGSDLWTHEFTDTGTLSYSWDAEPGRWMILAASDGEAPAPQVALTWTRVVPTPLLLPGIIAGSFIFLVGLVMSIFTFLSIREAKRAKARAAHDEPLVLPEDLDTSNFTRRQVRELSEALASTGEIPVHLLQLGQAPAHKPQDGSAASAPSGEYDPLDDLLVVPDSLEQNTGGQDLADWVKSAPNELSPQAGYFAAGISTGASAASAEEITDDEPDDADESKAEKPRWQEIWSSWADSKTADPKAAELKSADPTSGDDAPPPPPVNSPSEEGEPGVGEADDDGEGASSAASPQISGAHWRETWRQALNQEKEGDER